MYISNFPCNNYSKRCILIIIFLAWILIIGIVLAIKEVKPLETSWRSPSEIPLLLHSEIVQTQEAEVTVILWFENNTIPDEVWVNRPTPDWIWTYKDFDINDGKKLVTLTGKSSLNKKEESNLFAWYTTMVPQIENVGGKIYLDERIPQAIDISAYLSKKNAIPSQWVLLDNMVSSAAYQGTIETSVMAGRDRVNLQLLSRGKNTNGQTVLAIPALLKEF